MYDKTKIQIYEQARQDLDTGGTLVRFRKSKSCQNHLQLHTWLPNYVLLAVRTEKSLKNLFNQLRQGGTQNGHFTM